MTHPIPVDTREHSSNKNKLSTVLESVDIKVYLRGLLSHVSVTQAYTNQEDENIEAVYTFPLPRDAVLLDLSLEMNGKTLEAEVYVKSEAQDQYDNAIEDGDSAILLEQLGPGLFAVNAGNVQPGERAIVQFQYAQLHRWQGNDLRLHIPATLAPWYGEPGLEPYLIPEHALSAGPEFSLNFWIEGPLARADFDCPSHKMVEVSGGNGVREISLPKGRVDMDRDVVLVLKKPSGFSTCGIWARDLVGEETHEDESKSPPDAPQGGYAALVSFHPTVGQGMSGSQRCVTLVVDCSGSMAGDSIAQAKEALHEILSLLTPSDFFNLIAFGTHPDPLFKKPVAASPPNIRKAEQRVEELGATMGGTEIGQALEAAYRSPRIKGLAPDILLITDGNVWDEDGGVVEKAQRSGDRVFTVGVGSSVSESFLRNLAERTGGACELVSPRENMAGRIVRHFQRAGQLNVDSIKIDWPEGLVRQYPPKIEEMFLGDTLHVWGWFKEPPSGTVKLTMAFEDGQMASQAVNLWIGQEEAGGRLDDLPRVAAHSQLAELDPDEVLKAAESYKLVTEQTSYVLVLEREEDRKADGHPEIRKVPHTFAAGWGGVGTVHSFGTLMSLQALPEEFEDSKPQTITQSEGFRNLVLAINNLDSRGLPGALLPETISELGGFGLASQTVERLIDLASHAGSERDLVIAFLALLSLSYREKKLDSGVKKAIWFAYRQIDLPATVTASIAAIVDGSLNLPTPEIHS